MLRALHRLESLVTRHFSLFLIASLGAGLVLPSLSNACAPLIMPVLMVVIYLGFLNTDYTVMRGEIRNLKRLLWLNIFCLVLLPSFLYLTARGFESGFGTHPDWSTGVLLLFACPVAALGPTLALMMHGHFERTLCTLILSSILVPFTLPLLMSFWVGAPVEVSMWSMSLFLAKLILFPFLAARLTLRFFQPLKQALHPHTAALSVLFLALVVLGAVAGLSETILGNPTHVLEGVAIASGCMLIAYLIGWFSHAPGTPIADRSTLAIIATWTNIGLAIVFAREFFPRSDVLLFVILAEIPWNLAFAPAHAFIRYKSAGIR